MIRRLAIPAALALVVLGGAVPAASAGVVSRTAQTGYFCDIAQDGSSTPIDSDSMTLGMTLDVPTSVTPGERVALRGTLSLAFPESMSQDAKGFVTSANGYSDSMSLQLGVNGAATNVMADRWQTPEIAVGDPIVVHAPIAFPTITIPAAAKGEISLTMAQNNVIKNPNFPTPATIAFAAAAAASGPLGTFHFNLSCYLKGGSPSVLARIPVTAPAATTGTHAPTAPAGTPAGQTAPQGGTVPTQTAAAGTQVAPGTKAAAPSSRAAQRHRGTPARARRMETAYAASADQSGGIYVPAGVLVGLGVLVCACALAYAGWAHYRLRMLQRYLDD